MLYCTVLVSGLHTVQLLACQLVILCTHDSLPPFHATCTRLAHCKPFVAAMASLTEAAREESLRKETRASLRVSREVTDVDGCLL